MTKAEKEALADLTERQTEIIRIQTGVIDTLFRLLAVHITAEELDSLPVIDDINRAAQISAELNL